MPSRIFKEKETTTMMTREEMDNIIKENIAAMRKEEETTHKRMIDYQFKELEKYARPDFSDMTPTREPLVTSRLVESILKANQLLEDALTTQDTPVFGAIAANKVAKQANDIRAEAFKLTENFAKILKLIREDAEAGRYSTRILVKDVSITYDDRRDAHACTLALESLGFKVYFGSDYQIYWSTDDIK